MMDKKNITVVVGMSGGVDSSVAAALLLEEGYNVIGMTMKTYDYDDVGGNVSNETSCCGLTAMHDARMVATKLGIPHYVVDFRKEFGKEVIDNFVEEYLLGRTPNPCIICNREIKWNALLKKAEALGAQFIATGHYARLRFDEQRQRYILSRGTYSEKDQSY
ncbi:MAG TPA: tRNA 2-thiouridine(34) synthase MnmA, partial [Bacteroidota bacterium]|nr:tRNA 2-thiouridine(34) synthase MnmA [Bacteroidota bacterium]